MTQRVKIIGGSRRSNKQLCSLIQGKVMLCRWRSFNWFLVKIVERQLKYQLEQRMHIGNSITGFSGWWFCVIVFLNATDVPNQSFNCSWTNWISIRYSIIMTVTTTAASSFPLAPCPPKAFTFIHLQLRPPSDAQLPNILARLTVERFCSVSRVHGLLSNGLLIY